MVLKESLTKIEWGLAGIVLSSPLALRFAQYLEHQPTLCPLQRFAGMPCPSCGGTRAAFYLWGADPIQALKSNAGVTLLILAAVGFLARKMVTGNYFAGLGEEPQWRSARQDWQPQSLELTQ